MIRPIIRVDTRAFDAAFKEYLSYSKKDLNDIVNTKAYYIARNAVNLTDASTTNQIKADLLMASKVAPNAPLAAILVQKKQMEKGERGLYGTQMNKEVNRLIRIRRASANFLRAGWIAAIRHIEPYVPKKSGPGYRKVKVKGKEKGGASGSRSSTWNAMASIWNSVQGAVRKHGLNKRMGTSKIQDILTKGLQKAVDKEVASMKAYVEKKLQQTANRFNRR